MNQLDADHMTTVGVLIDDLASLGAVDDLQKVAQTLAKLSSYAQLIESSVRERIAGNITLARIREAAAQATYKSLPQEFKW